MIKTLKVLVLIFLTSKLSIAQTGFLIKGTVPSSLNGKVLSIDIFYDDLSQYKSADSRQTSVILDGKFSFHMPTKTPESYVIAVEGISKKANAYFVLAPKETELIFSDTLLKDYKVVGNDLYQEYIGLNKLTNPRMYGRGETRTLLAPLIERNVSSPLNVFFLGYFFDQYDQTKDAQFLKLWNMVPDSVKENSIGKELKFIAEHLMIGTMAPAFSIPDTAGVNIKLSDFKGKYVLLDFWASWCLPCRAENPSLIEAYSKFHDKKFDILSISIDKSRELWLKAIYEDKINQWKHVSTLQPPPITDVSGKLFKITSIPVNYLIDPQGKIVAKNIWGKDLIKFLRKAL